MYYSFTLLNRLTQSSLCIWYNNCDEGVDGLHAYTRMECALREVYQLAFSQVDDCRIYCIILLRVLYSAQSTLLIDYTSITSCMYEYIHIHVTHAGSSGGARGQSSRKGSGSSNTACMV